MFGETEIDDGMSSGIETMRSDTRCFVAFVTKHLQGM